MKQIVIILFGLISIAHAQIKKITDQNYIKANTTYGMGANRYIAEKGLFYPTGCGRPDSTYDIPNNAQKLAAKYRDTCGHIDYTFDPVLGWQIDSSSGGGTTIINNGTSDTTVQFTGDGSQTTISLTTNFLSISNAVVTSTNAGDGYTRTFSNGTATLHWATAPYGLVTVKITGKTTNSSGSSGTSSGTGLSNSQLDFLNALINNANNNLPE